MVGTYVRCSNLGKKFGYWRFIDNFTHAAMLEAATGLGLVGKV